MPSNLCCLCSGKYPMIFWTFGCTSYTGNQGRQAAEYGIAAHKISRHLAKDAHELRD